MPHGNGLIIEARRFTRDAKQLQMQLGDKWTEEKKKRIVLGGKQH